MRSAQNTGPKISHKRLSILKLRYTFYDLVRSIPIITSKFRYRNTDAKAIFQFYNQFDCSHTIKDTRIKEILIHHV